MEGKIKVVEELSDFKEVYKVFSGPPYNQEYTDDEIEEIFREYKNGGYVYGAYNGDNCVGIIALEEGEKEEHPVSFGEERIMYLADVAVLDSYRKAGIGTQLMIYATMQSKALGFQRLYMRTLGGGESMSEGIARKIGFKQIPGAYQDVERKSILGGTLIQRDIFLEIDLDSLDRKAMQEGIKESCSRSVEKER